MPRSHQGLSAKSASATIANATALSSTTRSGLLHDYAEEVLRFLADPRAPFDNNQAERDIRKPKLKQKVFRAFRTAKDAATFCTIRSYLATLRKQSRDLFESLVLTFKGKPPEPILSG